MSDSKQNRCQSRWSAASITSEQPSWFMRNVKPILHSPSLVFALKHCQGSLKVLAMKQTMQTAPAVRFHLSTDAAAVVMRLLRAK